MSRTSGFSKGARVVLYGSLLVFALFLAAEFGVRILSYVNTNDTRFLYWGISRAGVNQSDSGEGSFREAAARVLSVDIPAHPQPPPDVTRILVFESGRTGPGGPRNRSGWPEQLEAKLERQFSPHKFEVVYGGILAYAVSSARRVLTQQLKAYKFHIVILYLGMGDLGASLTRPDAAGGRFRSPSAS